MFNEHVLRGFSVRNRSAESLDEVQEVRVNGKLLFGLSVYVCVFVYVWCWELNPRPHACSASSISLSSILTQEEGYLEMFATSSSIVNDFEAPRA